MQVLATMRRKGKALPYDAEVEYLESTGTQHFDLGIKPNRDFVVRVKGKVATEIGDGYCSIFGRYIGTGGKTYYVEAVTYSTSYARFTGGGDGQVFGDYVVDSIKGYDFDIMISATDTTVNGNPWWHGNMGVVNDDEKTLYLFAINGRGNKFNGLMREFNISMNGEKVFDPIFVRVGTEGCLYDRVSGQLFRNAGTGAFVVGPDKYAPLGVLMPVAEGGAE